MAAPIKTPVAPDVTEERWALAEDLEAALRDALEAGSKVEEPSARQIRLTRALALANDEPVENLTAGATPVAPAASEYLSMIKSYGPFPLLLPTHRDFRPVLALSVFLGILGADRFYEGKHLTGALKLATAGGLGIWWIADIITILTGRAADKDGHHFAGEKKHRAIAWALTAALFAGLTTVAATAVAPAVTAAYEAVNAALFPKPVPVPTWAVLADIKGTPESAVLKVTGDRLRLTYSFPGPVYAFLQNEDDPTIPAESLLLKDTAMQGEKEIAVNPGKYRLVVRSDGAWTVKAEELGLHGDGD